MVFYSSNITMMHGPINVIFRVRFILLKSFCTYKIKMENEIGQTVGTRGVMGSVCDMFVINTEGVVLMRSYS